jgi:hypothetical protein
MEENIVIDFYIITHHILLEFFSQIFLKKNIRKRKLVTKLVEYINNLLSGVNLVWFKLIFIYFSNGKRLQEYLLC